MHILAIVVAILRIQNSYAMILYRIYPPYILLPKAIGFVCCLLRILFCVCPSSCLSSSRRKMKEQNGKVDADHTTSLLQGDNKRVLISKQEQVII